jgi:hypothetical protein
MRENVQYLSFLDWLISLTMMISGSTHFPANDIISFFFIAEEYFKVYICHNFIIHSSVDGHLGWFHKMVIVNSVQGLGIQEYLLRADLHFFWYMPRIGIAGSYDSSVLFLRNLHTYFHDGCIYIPTNSVKGFLFLPHLQ